MNVFELKDYNLKNILETESYSEINNNYQNKIENTLIENFEDNNIKNNNNINININLKKFNDNYKIEKNSLILKQFFKIIEYKLLDYFKQNNNINNIIYIINNIFYESSDIFLDYITQNIANFLLNLLNNNINNMQNNFSDENKTDFLLKKMNKKNKSLQSKNILLSNKKNKKYIEINGDKDIQKNINKILLTRNKQQLKKKFTLVQGTRSEHFLIPDKGINYRYYYYNSNNYCNKVYLKCSDTKCLGKIKMDMKNLEYIYLHNHNKEYKEHSYFKLDN